MLMTDRRSVGANAKVSGVFSGQLHEYVQSPGILRVYGTASAVGLNLTLNVGGDTLMNDQEVNSQNRMPIKPDDLILEHPVIPGDRIVADWRNTTGAAINGFLMAEVLPV
jgi:hypothetical protein